MGIPIDFFLAHHGFPATSERKGNSMDLSTIDRLYASLSTTWLIRITEEEATAAEAMVATMRLLSHALAAYVADPERPREVLLQELEAHIREAAAMAQGRLGAICDHDPSVVHEEDDAGPVSGGCPFRVGCVTSPGKAQNQVVGHAHNPTGIAEQFWGLLGATFRDNVSYTAPCMETIVFQLQIGSSRPVLRMV